MNKRFSTLVAAFAAFASVASAQIGDKYVYLVNTTSDTLTWTKAAGDSIAFKKAPTGTKAAMDSALWLPKFVKKIESGDSVFQFENKATKKLMSFAVTKNGADKYGTMVAAGVDQFVYNNGVSGGSAIYAAYENKLFTFSGSAQGEMVLTTDLSTGAKKFTAEDAGSYTLDTKEKLTGVLPTFKLDFNGKDGGLFTEGELVPVPADNDKFRFQIVGKENSTKGTKPAQYITIDTVAVGGSVKAASFQLDTLVAAGVAQYKGAGNAGLQTFKLIMDLGNDSIVITTDSIVRFDAQGVYEVAYHGGASSTYLVGHKDFVGSTKLVVDSMQITAPLIAIAKGTPVKLAGGTGVYSLQLKANGGNANATYNDLFLIGDGTAANSVAAASVYIPSTQFYVKENEDGTYSAQAREKGNVSAATAVNGSTTGQDIATPLFQNQPLYAVDAANGIYHWGTGDTVVFTKLDVDMANKNLGYKYFTREEMGFGAVKFNLASKAADDIYLALTQDSVIKGAKGIDNALELRLIEGAELANSDTVVYGAQALGDTLFRVAYAMEKPYNADGRKLAYEAVNTVNVVKLSKKATLQNKRFFFVENPAGESYKIVEAAIGTPSASMVTMNISSLAVTYDEPTASVETYFNIEGAEAPTYAKVAPGHYNVVNGNEMLTADADAAKFMRVGDELKATAEDSDFSLYIDSAYVNRGDDNTNYGYYIYKGATVKIASTEAAADTIKGYVLSAPKADNFKSATATGDSVIFCDATVIADTLWYDGEVDKKGNPIKHEVTSNKSVVMFEVQPSGDYAAVLMNAPAKKLAVVNGTVIFTDDVAAQPLTLTASEAPTANETTPSVSEVTVIAANGAIQIVGAQGKKVVVSNILGQTIANTVISSDNATIAAPAGVVVVAVEGEEAVKAIVK